jgi:uncharacterized membrane protein YbhN (UPF0104 family)
LLLAAAGCLTAWVLHRQFGQTSSAELSAAMAAQPVLHAWAALLLTATSFAALALYDVFGVAAVAPRRVPTHIALLAGGTANAIANTLGFHAITGSAVRARVYARHGLSAADIVRVASLSWLALGLGFLTMLALAEFVQWRASSFAAPTTLCVGIGISAGLLVFIAWLGGAPRRLTLFGFSQPLPSAGAAAIQLVVGAVESAAAIGALYVLLPADLAPPFGAFAVGYIVAITAGTVAHVPGGIGVFEAGITAMLSGAGRADLLAALLLYRLLYNILPFLLSIGLLLWHSQGKAPRSIRGRVPADEHLLP